MVEAGRGLLLCTADYLTCFRNNCTRRKTSVRIAADVHETNVDAPAYFPRKRAVVRLFGRSNWGALHSRACKCGVLKDWELPLQH